MTTMDNQQLQQALLRLDRTYVPNGLHLITSSDEYIFLEDALIRQGVLHPDKNGCAHTAFLQLLDRLDFTWHAGKPTTVVLSRAFQKKDTHPGKKRISLIDKALDDYLREATK